MTDKDFSACEFIDECLRFTTYIDFCNNARVIKAVYQAMEKDAKRFYKWYVYANIHMLEKYKDLVWKYLNSEEPEDYVILMTNKRTYRVK